MAPESGYPEEETVIRTEEEDGTTPDMNGAGETASPVPALGSPGLFSTPSIVDLFKKEQEELASAKTVFIPIKGYEQTGLQAQYRMPDSGKELDNIMNKVQRQHKDTYSRNLYASIDTMIHLCEGLYVQPEGVEEPVMLDPEETGVPCTFDNTLAGMLGMDQNENTLTARAVVKKLFGNNELAIMSHAFDLNRWLQNTKADLNLEIWQLGE